jgi:putative ubiquitin-RnfH superfamily antitoxin RatB of RatAB toxin-antitoxin module
MGPEMKIRVTCIYSPSPRTVNEVELLLPSGSMVSLALQASAVQTLCPDLDLSKATIGVWGRKASPRQILRDQDRIEIYRPLRVNPKIARRERFAKQGARTTGLFATRRAGSKAGY